MLLLLTHTGTRRSTNPITIHPGKFWFCFRSSSAWPREPECCVGCRGLSFSTNCLLMHRTLMQFVYLFAQVHLRARLGSPVCHARHCVIPGVVPVCCVAHDVASPARPPFWPVAVGCCCCCLLSSSFPYLGVLKSPTISPQVYHVTGFDLASRPLKLYAAQLGLNFLWPLVRVAPFTLLACAVTNKQTCRRGP